MTAVLIVIAYLAVALLTARWFYRVNVEAGQIDTTSLKDTQLSVAVVLLIGAFWPLVFAWLGALRFIARPARGGQQ